MEFEFLTKSTTNVKTNLLIGELKISKSVIGTSIATLNSYGLKEHKYLAIGNKPNGKLVAVFSKVKRDGMFKIGAVSKKSQQLYAALNTLSRNILKNYIGVYSFEKTTTSSDFIIIDLTPKK